MDVVPGIVEKSLGSTRAGTKRKGMDVCAMYVEVENGAEGVLVSSRWKTQPDWTVGRTCWS